MLGPPLFALILGMGVVPLDVAVTILRRLTALVSVPASAAAMPPVGPRIEPFGIFGFGLRSVDPFDVLTEQLLDRLERLHVPGRHEHRRVTLAARAAGAADAMHIVLGMD